MRNIRFISDIHLDYLSRKEKTHLLKFLEETPDICKRLFVVGDAFDAPPGKKKAFPANLDVIEMLFQIIKERVDVTYVVGNHDIAISALTMKTKWLEICYPSKKITNGNKSFFIEHGHAHDPFYRTHLYGMAQLFEEISGVDPGEVVVDFLEDVASILQKPQRKKVLGVPKLVLKKWENAAAKRLEDTGSDVVIMGHTHFPVLKKFSGGLYANCGSWLTQMTYIDYDGASIKLMRFGEKKALAEARI